MHYGNNKGLLDSQLDKNNPYQALNRGNDEKGIRQPIRQQYAPLKIGSLTAFISMWVVITAFIRYVSRLKSG